MTPRRRWLLVGVAAIVAVGVPASLPAWPSRDSDVNVIDLFAAVRASSSEAWSGEVRTQGTLQIPDTDSFGGVARLLGEESTLRVWWRSPIHWRIDRIRPSGETDLVRDAASMTSWVFESRTATVSPYSDVRLPDDSDLLPPRLAARLLAGATPGEMSRLPARRIAGRDAPGLRLAPRDGRSTVRQVDVWADADSGLPLRVEVFGFAAVQPVVTARFVRLDLDEPPARSTQLHPAAGAETRSRDSLDVAAAANVFAPFELPDSLAGLDRRGDSTGLGAVGIYGRGPTSMLVIPLRDRLSHRVRDQLASAASARETTGGTALQVGPLSVLHTRGRHERGTFLLAGTVTSQTLSDSANELRATVRLR